MHSVEQIAGVEHIARIKEEVEEASEEGILDGESCGEDEGMDLPKVMWVGSGRVQEEGDGLLGEREEGRNSARSHVNRTESCPKCQLTSLVWDVRLLVSRQQVSHIISYFKLK